VESLSRQIQDLKEEYKDPRILEEVNERVKRQLQEHTKHVSAVNKEHTKRVCAIGEDSKKHLVDTLVTKEEFKHDLKEALDAHFAKCDEQLTKRVMECADRLQGLVQGEVARVEKMVSPTFADIVKQGLPPASQANVTNLIRQEVRDQDRRSSNIIISGLNSSSSKEAERTVRSVLADLRCPRTSMCQLSREPKAIFNESG
jgi:hypothetical protein